jgi:hypothetical protein
VFFKGVPLASGGSAFRGHPYLVGERGPELFVPRASGTVVPNSALGGGGTVRFDTSSLPPIPRPGSPYEYALADWFRQVWSHAKLDYDDRGGL